MNEQFDTFIISSDKDFASHFQGFKSLKCVSYVTSLQWLLEFIEKNTFESIEIIIGKEASDLKPEDILKEELRGNTEMVEKILTLTKENKLRIYIANRIIHSKFYILEGEKSIRAIQGSANLTIAARRGKQINYMWEFNLNKENDITLIKKFYKDYEKHMEYCSLFMEDLMEMVASSDNNDSNRIIKHWLSKAEDNENISVMPLLTKLGTEVLNDSNGEPIYRMTLPSDPVQRKSVEQILKPVKYEKSASEITFMKRDFLDSETLMVPLMRTDFISKSIIFNIKSEKFVIGNSIQEPSKINDYLSDIEDYIKTVDMGQTRNENISKMTKMSMYEGLIYFFSSPFMNEYMRLKREKVGNIDERGPRFLFISGGSSNGKTTFIKYILHLMTGKDITPIDKSKFSKNYILKAASLGTTFPLVFDDVPPQRLNSSDMETTIKSYWETWWNKDSIFPEIIVSSNARSTKEWYQTRMKTLNFDVHFEPSMKAREILSEIFNRENNIFSAFVNYYFRNYSGELYDDELYTGRKAMLELYNYAGRTIPEYFPEVPVEEVYDPDKVKWQELIDMKKVELVDKEDSLEIIFADGFTRTDVEHYADSIKHAKHRVVGTTIVVDSPEDFRKWLGIDNKAKKGLLSKLFGNKKR